LATGSVLKFAEKEVMAVEGWAIALISIFAALCVLNLVIIGLQPSSGTKLFFRVRQKNSILRFSSPFTWLSADSNFLLCVRRFARSAKSVITLPKILSD
jgi:hypothetical protein